MSNQPSPFIWNPSRTLCLNARFVTGFEVSVVLNKRTDVSAYLWGEDVPYGVASFKEKSDAEAWIEEQAEIIRAAGPVTATLPRAFVATEAKVWPPQEDEDA